MKKNELIALFLLGIILSSCQEEKPYVYQCEDGPVKFELFNDELNAKVRFKDLGSFDMQYKIIQSEHQMYQDLEILYLKNKIDFNSKSLVVISVKLTTYAQVMTQNIVANCKGNGLTVSAQLRYGSQPRDGVSYVCAIIPKVPLNTKIEFIPSYSY